ncbi:MAG: cob(I)yrinic acid a,c-diamide adenosyltransferase [Planctomycetota bacterium]
MRANAPQPGRVLVFTGDGKGKTAAALGLALRAHGHGLRVCIIQFIKSRTDVGEVMAAQALGPGLELFPMGAGFVRQEGGTPADRARAAEALDLARARMSECDVLVLDEINGAVKLKLIAVDDLLALIRGKPEELHVILTGRDAHPLVIEAADTVTDMTSVKHAYDAGVTAQRGIDF